MDEKNVTNEAKTNYYDRQIQSLENETLTLKSKISRLQIRLHELKRQQNQKRIAELFIRGR